MIGAIPWIPMQNRKALNPTLATSYNGDYGMIPVPELGTNIAIHSYGERADNSAVNGETQDVTINIELSIDFGFVPAPLSVSTETVIFTSGILA